MADTASACPSDPSKQEAPRVSSMSSWQYLHSTNYEMTVQHKGVTNFDIIEPQLEPNSIS